MSYIAVANRCPLADDATVAFWSEAWNAQAKEVADAHEVEYTPVVFYSSSESLPNDCRILTIQETLDEPGALGYHTEEAGAILARIKYSGPDTTSITGSHETIEEEGDPLCNRWKPFDDDHEQAFELADRVEGDWYLQPATVLGETRQIRVSNYLLPSAFDPDGKPPYDRMGKLLFKNDMTPGGYAILRDITTGKVANVFARRGPFMRIGSNAAELVASKLSRRESRLLTRLAR